MSLINLDVDKLFEQHNINEIEAVNRKIQYEVEKKKEELRTMVGERYRDLIAAADTIAEMKNTASTMANVTKIQVYSEKFNQQNLLGTFEDGKVESNKKNLNSSKNHIYAIIVQIKILTILLEMISTAIDENDVMSATQLFMLSRHISTSLKLDANSDIMKKFPVAKKQWDLLTPYYHTIKQQCLNALEKENISVEECAKCLASLLLLENAQFVKLLNAFIQSRIKTFTRIIESEDYTLVKDKLLASVKILINTTEIIYHCFIEHEGDDGLLLQELRKITNDKAPYTLSLLMRHQKSAIYQTLPDIIAKYKPHIQINALSKENVDSAIKSWIDSVEKITQNQLSDIAKFIGSIKTIQDIKQQVHNIEKPKNWSKICSDLFQVNNLDFYNRFYQPVMFQRIYNIIKISWGNIQTEFINDVEKLITEEDKVHRDMRNYVWSDDSSDNPQSLKEALSTNNRSHRLLMKVNGYSVSIVEICSKIDSNLELLFNDLKEYLCGSLSMQGLKNDVDQQEDHKKLIIFLRECSKENTSAFITFMKSTTSVKTSENSILIARLLQSLTDLCPNLKLSFSGNLLIEQSYMLRQSSTDAEGVEEWNKISSLLIEESIKFWETWLNSFLDQWPQLKPSLTVETIFKDFPCWESITIEEKDESDNVIESQIFVPQQLSLSIQCWIFNIILSLNRIIPHTLPKSIHIQIVDQLVTRLYQYYEALSKEELVNTNQKISWQFLFDLKVLTILFVRRENKALTENYQQLITHFRNVIDPFDFDVFYQYVNFNIKRNASKLQYEMGCLIPNMEALTGLLSSQNVQSSHDKEPNILTMSVPLQEKNWFPLLPITATKDSSSTLETDKLKKKQVAPTKQQNSSKKPLMHVSASTSALSSLQDWFR